MIVCILDMHSTFKNKQVLIYSSHILIKTNIYYILLSNIEKRKTNPSNIKKGLNKPQMLSI